MQSQEIKEEKKEVLQTADQNIASKDFVSDVKTVLSISQIALGDELDAT